MTRAINFDRWRRPPIILRYGLGVLTVIAAAIIQHFGDMRFAVTPSFVCAVMVSGWFGGMGPGLLSTALSILALKYYFVPPTGTFAIDTAYIPSITLFSLVALFVTWLSSRERKAAMSLVHAHDQLDLKIHELEKSNESLQAVQMELAHANRVATMGQLSASIAHEISQPIGAGLSYANAASHWLAAQPPNLEEVRRDLGFIVESGIRANEVIDRIRALVKKAPPRKNRLEINEAILQIIALAQNEMANSGISVRTQLAEALPAIQGDRVQLQQVILNLLINAIEAMSGMSGGPRELLISTAKTDSEGVLIAVRDSGPGLAPESVDRLFESFYTTKPNGLGMGLSIYRSIIEAHGGRLWATANAPHGAVFQFTLPPYSYGEKENR